MLAVLGGAAQIFWLWEMAPRRTIDAFFQAPTNTKRVKVASDIVGDLHASAEDGSEFSFRTLKDNDLDPIEKKEGVINEQQKILMDALCSPTEKNAKEESSMSEEQKIRMELNKSMACAKRNLRMCEETVQSLNGEYPDLKDLLVEPTWREVLNEEFKKPYMERLEKFIKQEAAGKIPIYPPAPKVFNAFNSCPFDRVKVVLIGQDPYHGEGQAMGLSFSVPEGIKVPSSLVNIYKEIQNDVGCKIPKHGNLEKWTYQGVLLLNAVLTVRAHQANSHAKKGWEAFTDAAIRAVSNRKTGVVFLLWGNSAQEKIRLIDTKVHHVLKAAHPSGLSAHKGFFNCGHFSKANKILKDAGLTPIDWQI